MRRTVTLFITVLMLSMLSATADSTIEDVKNGVSEVDNVDLKGLVARSEARWSTIVNHAFNKTYQFETSAYRDVFTEKMFVSRFNAHMNWKVLSRKEPVYNPVTKVAIVVVEVETQPSNSKGLDTGTPAFSVEIREKWLNNKSQWWYSSSE